MVWMTTWGAIGGATMRGVRDVVPCVGITGGRIGWIVGGVGSVVGVFGCGAGADAGATVFGDGVAVCTTGGGVCGTSLEGVVGVSRDK